MKILVVGKGGREHALAWKLAQSPRADELFAAPGSPGIAAHATCLPQFHVDLAASEGDRLTCEIERLKEWALLEKINLTVVGPEDALAGGLVDRFTEAGLLCFGPTADAARIESDKAFSKDLMERTGVPTAAHRTFTDSGEAIAYIREQGAPIVVKASGLAAGKGAIVAHTVKEAEAAIHQMIDDAAFGEAGAHVVVEEFMTGEEASLFAICDGADYVTLVTAQDHKAIGEGDSGPNTGGMGAYAPAPVMTDALLKQAEAEVIRPVLNEMQRLGCPYRGVLYVGLMMTDEGPKVVEFNCRFGDPETQVILPLLRSDLVDLCEASATGSISDIDVELDHSRAAVCVVAASGGYPGSYEKGIAIDGLESLTGQDLVAFHAGTDRVDDRLVTAGGRVLGVTATADDLPRAVEIAYESLAKVHFDGMYYRRDIAHRALGRRPS